MKLPQSPPALRDLFEKKGGEIGAVIGQPEFMDFVQRCEKSYLHWNKVRFMAPKDVDPELAWLIVKTGRIARYTMLPLNGTKGVNLRFNMTDDIQRELMLIDQQLAGRLTSHDANPLNPHQRERFSLTALREEAIASSMLEGAATTRRDAKKLLKSGRKPRTLGERMVWNNYRAIMFIREHNKTPLTKELLLELHAVLTTGTMDDPDSVGRLRNANDSISVIDGRDNTTVHIPPSAEELEERIEALCTFANKPSASKVFVHPVVRACVLHFQLGFDHPFCDGNGRMARSLFYWSMLREGYYLFEYLPISRLIFRSLGKYTRSYVCCENDDFDLTYFLKYKLRIIRMAREELRRYIDKKQHQLAEARRLFPKDRRLNHRQQEVVLRAVRNPDRVFTIAEHQKDFAVAYGTARADLLELSEWGYLIKTASGKRFDFYASERLRSAE